MQRASGLSRGEAAQEPGSGGVRRGCSAPAGADTPPRRAPHSGEEREKRRRAPQGELSAAPSTGGARGTKGRPSERSSPRRGSRLSRYKSSDRKIPRGVPAAERRGRGPAPARRPRTSCVSVPGSGLQFPPLLPPAKGARPLARASPEAGWAPLSVRIGPAANLRTNGVHPCPRPRLLPRRRRVTAPSSRCALRDPRPLRVRSRAAAAACNLRRQDVAGG